MKFREFNVLPNLPEKLRPLLDLSYNIWWAWDSEAFGIYRDIDPDLWSGVSHNPVKYLHYLPQEKLDSIAKDEGFLYRIDSVLKRRDQYMRRSAWFEKVRNSLPADFLAAYFSLEFGLAECLPIYSGGLGVLAGDHLKSASDLGIPLIAVGLLYSEGYFHQYLSNDGWQHERYVKYDYNISPISVVKNKDGSPLKLDLKLPHAVIKYQVWKVQVGRVTLYLLDTNLPENGPEDQEITSKLYGGDLETRIKQEILLGIGGMAALTVLNINPTVTHMNEGHSSFLSLERIRLIMQKNNLSFNEAQEVTAASSVFTTHTPVPAGNDRFPLDLMERYLKEYVEKNLKISFDEFIQLGRVHPDDAKEWFCMTVLALKLSHYSNGVSKLHGHVSRGMWKDIWTGVPLSEVPITHITNGTHGASWISKEIADLFYRYLGTKWMDQPEDREIWKRIVEIPDIELWRTHERRRDRLVAFVRRKVKNQLVERNAPAEEVDRAAEILTPDALTIGFARRFATYKRANLIFRDLERLKKILNHPDMPVQIIFAGKAHPKDDAGKEFIKQVFHTALQDEFRDKIVFVEDYDLNTAHYLVQGVDVWLNNPRRPLEASGTSGMKVNFNGGLNFSVVDGWWAEKPDADNGWLIGRGEEYEDTEYQDSVEANSLYETLENEIIPLFYKRGKDDLPHDWIKKMKNSMITLCPVFNTDRMVMEYTEKFYKPGGKQYEKLIHSGYEKARNINKWKEKLCKLWNGVKVVEFISESFKDITVGGSINVTSVIDGGGLSHDDLLVEVYYGYDRSEKELVDIDTCSMNFKENKGSLFVFEGNIKPNLSGKIRFTIRVLPANPDLPVKFIPGYIKWSEG
jgi:glycogen phosphorylase